MRDGITRTINGDLAKDPPCLRASVRVMVFHEFFSHGATKARRFFLEISVDGSSDPVAHECLSKIQQVAQIESREPKSPVRRTSVPR